MPASVMIPTIQRTAFDYRGTTSNVVQSFVPEMKDSIINLMVRKLDVGIIAIRVKVVSDNLGRAMPCAGATASTVD
jgi:hypothetical protein